MSPLVDEAAGERTVAGDDAAQLGTAGQGRGDAVAHGGQLVLRDDAVDHAPPLGPHAAERLLGADGVGAVAVAHAARDLLADDDVAQQRLHRSGQRRVLLGRDRDHVVGAQPAFGRRLLVLADTGGQHVDVVPPRCVADRHADARTVADVVAVGVPDAAVDHQHVARVHVRLQLRRNRRVLAVAVVARGVVPEAVAARDDRGAAGGGAELGERPEGGDVHRRVDRVWVQDLLVLPQAERPVAVPVGAAVTGRGDDAVRHGDAHRRAEPRVSDAEQPLLGDVRRERLRLGDQPADADAWLVRVPLPP